MSLTPVTDGETEAWRGKMTCSMSLSREPDPGGQHHWMHHSLHTPSPFPQCTGAGCLGA